MIARMRASGLRSGRGAPRRRSCRAAPAARAVMGKEDAAENPRVTRRTRESGNEMRNRGRSHRRWAPLRPGPSGPQERSSGQRLRGEPFPVRRRRAASEARRRYTPAVSGLCPQEAFGLKTYRVDYDRSSNEEQREVVLAGSGPILVIAERARERLGRSSTGSPADRVGTDPSRILLLTFTNKARGKCCGGSRRPERGHRRLTGGTFTPSATASCAGSGRGSADAELHDPRPRGFREMLEASISDRKSPSSSSGFRRGRLLDLYSYTSTRAGPSRKCCGAAPHFAAGRADSGRLPAYRDRKRLAGGLRL